MNGSNKAAANRTQDRHQTLRRSPSQVWRECPDRASKVAGEETFRLGDNLTDPSGLWPPPWNYALVWNQT
jgi:hypothetical protein